MNNSLQELTPAQFLKITAAMANSNRIRIIEILSGCAGLSSQDLLEKFEFTIKQPTMSQHIKVLRDCELVEVKKDSKWQYFYINTDLLEGYLDYLANNIIQPAKKSNEEDRTAYNRSSKPKTESQQKIESLKKLVSAK